MFSQKSRPQAPSRLHQSFTSDQTGEGVSMAETNFPGNSTKTLPGTVGRHDGHQDGHLNCIALRHGWTRTFSISPEELAVIDYDTLERILEINTLRIRPMALRIFVEQPAESGAWSKVRSWKHDNSLQSILIQKYLEERRATGVITRFEVRDGADRRDDASDSHSLRAVGSRIVHTMHYRGETTSTSTSTGANGGQGSSGWLGTLIRRRSTVQGKKKQQQQQQSSTDHEDEDEAGEIEQTPEPPAKQASSSIFGYFNPMALFSSASSSAAPAAEAQSLVSPEEARAAEVEQLRKRGWMPPGLARRQKSLQDRLRAVEGRNPFLGGSRVYRGKKSSAGSSETDHNPFADPDATEITPQEVDEFFEIDRTSSILELNNRPANMTPNKDKTWSRLKGGKSKNKGKHKQELGGAEIVRQPEDAFPDSPHHSKHSLNKIQDDDE